MLCQMCNQNEATTLFTKTINSSSSVMNICSECAFKLGFNNMINSFSLGDIEPQAHSKETHCDQCLMTLEKITKIGKMGCSNCYNVFRAELLPSIQKIHGKVYHVGKTPSLKSTDSPQKVLDVLGQKLERAIKEQEYEVAASIRDRINKIREED